MVKQMWQRLRNRHREILSQLYEMELDVERTSQRKKPVPIWPDGGIKGTVAIIAFWGMLVCVASVAWYVLRSGK